MYRITVIVYRTHFKGYFETLTLTSWYQHQHCKILFFPYSFFYFEKIQHLWPMQLFGSFIKASILKYLIQVHFANLLGIRKTTCLKRFMSVLDKQKKACLKDFRHVQKCAHEIACLMWKCLNKLCSLFVSGIYVLLNKKWKYITALSDHECSE